MVPDGIGAFQDFMAGRGQEMTYRNVFKIIGQDNFVVAYSHVSIDQELPLLTCSGLKTTGSSSIGTTWSQSPKVPSPTVESSSGAATGGAGPLDVATLSGTVTQPTIAA